MNETRTEYESTLAELQNDLRRRWPLPGDVAIAASNVNEVVQIQVTYHRDGEAPVKVATLTGPPAVATELLDGRVDLAKALTTGLQIEATVGGWSFAAYLFSGEWSPASDTPANLAS